MVNFFKFSTVDTSGTQYSAATFVNETVREWEL